MTEQNTQIKLIRLNTGEDIIATCMTNHENDFVVIGNPMRVVVRRISERGQAVLMMMPWLPLELIEEDLATINNSDIITMVSPKPSFVEYYFNIVQQYQTLSENEESMFNFEDPSDGEEDEEITEDMVQEMFELLNDKKKHSIH